MPMRWVLSRWDSELRSTSKSLIAEVMSIAIADHYPYRVLRIHGVVCTTNYCFSLPPGMYVHGEAGVSR